MSVIDYMYHVYYVLCHLCVNAKIVNLSYTEKHSHIRECTESQIYDLHGHTTEYSWFGGGIGNWTPSQDRAPWHSKRAWLYDRGQVISLNWHASGIVHWTVHDELLGHEILLDIQLDLSHVTFNDVDVVAMIVVWSQPASLQLKLHAEFDGHWTVVLLHIAGLAALEKQVI